jgi:hypothetical protein
MKTFKKIVRHICLILLIILASIGIGISGGVPITPTLRRNEHMEIITELVKSEEADSATQADNQKQ